jgi:hypothetical protein
MYLDKNKERKRHKLYKFNLYSYCSMRKEYDNYSPSKKIEIQIAMHNAFSLELKAIEQIYKIEKVDKLEQKIIDYHQNFLRKKIWLCEETINNIYNNLKEDDPSRNKIFKKIKAAKINTWPYGVPNIQIEMPKGEIDALNPADKIKALIMYSNLFELELEEIEKREHKTLLLKDAYVHAYGFFFLNEVGKFSSVENNWIVGESRFYREEIPYDYLILVHHAEERMKIINRIHSEIRFIYHKVVPKHCPYRKELLERIQYAEVIGSGYKIMKKKEVMDARTGDNIDSKSIIYNYKVLKKDYDAYSPKKKIEVGIAFHSLYVLLINAFNKWRASREMDSYEKVVSEYHYNSLKHELSIWDWKIIHTYYTELLPGVAYQNEIRKKIEAANISQLPYKNGVAPISYNELLSNLNKLPPQERIKYRIVERNLFAAECDMILKNYKPQKLSKYEKIIFRSYCAYHSKTVVYKDSEIHQIFHEELPKDSPYKKELREKMLSANVSDKVYFAEVHREDL